MTLEERVRELEKHDIERDKAISYIKGGMTVIITMNVAILLAVAFLAFRL